VGHGIWTPAFIISGMNYCSIGSCTSS